MNKALSILKNTKSVTERAEKFETAIKRELQKDVIDVLVNKKESLEEKLFELQDFSLETDINQGMIKLTMDQCKKRFKDIIDVEYQLAIVSMELKVKQDSFNKYFEETPDNSNG